MGAQTLVEFWLSMMLIFVDLNICLIIWLCSHENKSFKKIILNLQLRRVVFVTC